MERPQLSTSCEPLTELFKRESAKPPQSLVWPACFLPPMSCCVLIANSSDTGDHAPQTYGVSSAAPIQQMALEPPRPSAHQRSTHQTLASRWLMSNTQQIPTHRFRRHLLLCIRSTTFDRSFVRKSPISRQFSSETAMESLPQRPGNNSRVSDRSSMQRRRTHPRLF
ncbi:unannotated protein [freshwater metagenome]|uniref:Unannotated protein n=1 Tax=freshwater metagenome TaxID=449393 RepID=A0A6J6JVQ1_9ZZZZ